MEHFDLSYDIVHNMSVHPYDSEVSLYQDKFLEADQYNNYQLSTGTHAGTHIDAPMHMTDDQTFIGDYPLERFCGKGIVLDVRGQAVIDMSDHQAEKVRENDIVLFYTGQEEKYGTSSYYSDHPILGRESAKILIEKKVKLIGLDSFSPDPYPFDIHKLLFKHGIFIVENLRNLSPLVNKAGVEFFMFPLKIRADASLIRAVARV